MYTLDVLFTPFDGHAETPDFPCLCHRKFVIQALLYSLMFCRLIADGLMVFSAVSRVSSFEVANDTDDLVGTGQEKTTTCFVAPQ